MLCEITDSCKENNYLCVEVFGHEGDHRCGEGNHKCASLCSVPECAFLCNKESNHLDEEHNCGNKHPCKEGCFNSFCTRSC